MRCPELTKKNFAVITAETHYMFQNMRIALYSHFNSSCSPVRKPVFMNKKKLWLPATHLDKIFYVSLHTKKKTGIPQGSSNKWLFYAMPPIKRQYLFWHTNNKMLMFNRHEMDIMFNRHEMDNHFIAWDFWKFSEFLVITVNYSLPRDIWRICPGFWDQLLPCVTATVPPRPPLLK